MTTGTGAVYDRGYRPYEGERGGRLAATLALYRTSLRRATGIRRPWRQKVMPALLLGVTSVPALVQVGVGYLTRNTQATDFQFITYREYVGVSSALILFVAIIAPDIVCPDRRQRILPLIFARPLTGRDYAIAKIGAIFTCVFAFSYLPQVVLYVGQLLVNDNGSLNYLQDNTAVLWKVPVACAALALFYAVLGIAVASLSGRRIVAAATMFGVTLVPATVSAALVEAHRHGRHDPGGDAAGLINVLHLPLEVRDLIFLGRLNTDSKLSGLAGGGAMALGAYVLVLVVCIGTVLYRYRSAE
jgi:ABC-2 type transport system permease protein